MQFRCFPAWLHRVIVKQHRMLSSIPRARCHKNHRGLKGRLQTVMRLDLDVFLHHGDFITVARALTLG